MVDLNCLKVCLLLIKIMICSVTSITGVPQIEKEIAVGSVIDATQAVGRKVGGGGGLSGEPTWFYIVGNIIMSPQQIEMNT